MCLFSIIIPTYNRENFISETINSVLESDYKNFEIIVVDDGSTDNTKDIVNKINDSRLNYYYQDNKERGAARNNGIKKAKGEYVFF
jgi:glycosyltransferase involved in cell wall biosynthesis